MSKYSNLLTATKSIFLKQNIGKKALVIMGVKKHL